ncbi:MAG: aminodeoxychorismate/anthranilate synthase component II [Ignavibacteria bacterium]|nr:aminodeoxychorismate/anthranilate synthase component II [Ignavibacteria bacterium]
MILVIDNYDSFTFNLVQQLAKFNANYIVLKNDEINSELIQKINPSKILISPGPGRPENSKGSLIAIKEFNKQIPILGVCLGHQAIGYLFGAKIIRAKNILHGKTSEIKNDGKTIFRNLPEKFLAARYHSLVIDEKSLSEEFEISAKSDDNEIMAIRHKHFPIEGVQFHPESILTKFGDELIKNWIEM